MAIAKEIITDINDYIGKNPGHKNSDWYVGIAADPRARLFTDHAVTEKGGTGAWIYRKADSHTIARAAEKAYHDAGYAGGPGGGDDSTVYVYAYLVTSTTVE